MTLSYDLVRSTDPETHPGGSEVRSVCETKARRKSIPAEEWLLYLILLSLPFDHLLFSIIGTTVESDLFNLSRALGLLFLGVVVWKALWLKDAEPVRLALSNPVSILALCYVGVPILSALASKSPSKTLYAVTDRGGMFCYLIASVHVIRNRDVLHRCIVAMVCPIAITTIAGAYEFVSGQHLVDVSKVFGGQVISIGDADVLFGTMRVRGLTDDADLHGVNMLLQLGGLLYLNTIAKTRKWRIVGKCLLFLVSANIVATASRGCWLGFAVVVAGFFLLAPVVHKRRAVLWIIACTTVLAVVAFFSYGEYLVVREKILGGNPAIGSTGLRVGQVLVATHIVRAHPWLGIGSGAWHAEYPKYARKVPWTEKSGNWDLHNWYAGIAIENGILGLVMFLAFLLAVFRSMWVSVHVARDFDAKCCAVGLLVSFLAYAYGLAFFSILDCRYSWTVMALGIAMERIFLAEQKLQGAEKACL